MRALREASLIDLTKASNYGFHKLLAEQLVRHYARRWIILRLAGMVGPGLRKNPVYDILHSQPLWIHPESRYQFMATEEVARIAWSLAQKGHTEEVFNVCGEGLISLKQIAEQAKRELDTSRLGAEAKPRIVDVNMDKVRRLFEVPRTEEAIAGFIQAASQAETTPLPCS